VISDRIPILVTGGAGYIGSHTAKALHRAGFQPIVFDNLSAGHRDAVRWGPFIEGDCQDTELVSAILRQYRVKAVIHFAAYAYVGESVENPRKYFNNNCLGTLRLFEALLAENCRYIVFSSSCATYGAPSRVPIDEGQLQHPTNPYGESKLFVERVLHWYGKAYDLRFLALRYFNAAGADPEGELFERHDPETHLIPLAIQATKGQIPFLEIYGTDYPTPDGTAVRDFVHVTDISEAHVHALHYLLRGGESCALNLGSGTGHSVREVTEAVSRITGRPVPVRERPRRPGDPPVLVADPSEARLMLDWRAKLSDLSTIINTASSSPQFVGVRGSHLAESQSAARLAR
jgi:UDP-arabinose 4-epimerase